MRPLPDDIPESNASKSGRQRAIERASRENLTVPRLAQRLGGYSGLAMVGTAKTIADEMVEWLFTEAADGFTMIASRPDLPSLVAVEGADGCPHLVPPQRRLMRRAPGALNQTGRAPFCALS